MQDALIAQASYGYEEIIDRTSITNIMRHQLVQSYTSRSTRSQGAKRGISLSLEFIIHMWRPFSYVYDECCHPALAWCLVVLFDRQTRVVTLRVDEIVMT